MVSSGPNDKSRTDYIPALGFSFLTPLYDPIVRLTTRENAFKGELVKQCDLKSGSRLLDLACGTGTLAISLKRSCVGATVVGVDGDAEILNIAKKKARISTTPIQFVRGLSADLPFADGYFDSVVSSLFFHHLTREAKIRTLGEVLRVLKSGGQLHIADWGKPGNEMMSIASLAIRALDGFEATRDNFKGYLSEIIHGAGFSEIVECSSFNTVFGTIRLISAKRA